LFTIRGYAAGMMPRTRNGFTLVELSVVLVVISLLIGGILIGQDLIKAAAIRATVAQIEKYESAVETFRGKYDGLPGDLKASDAVGVGLFARGGGAGDGDGNGKVEGIGAPGNSVPLGGETVFFWTDLSAAGLIDGSFTQSADANVNTLCCLGDIAAPYLPMAKTGHHGYFVAYENLSASVGGVPGYSGLMFEVGQVANTLGGFVRGGAGMTVLEAESVDAKIDDGMPYSGHVLSGSSGMSSSFGVVGTYSALNPGPSGIYCASNATTPPYYNTAFPDNVNCNLMIETGL